MERKTKIKFTDFECNLLINGMNEFRNIAEKDVDAVCRRFDKKRANYYAFNTSKKWDDFNNYDMVLDSSALGIDGCADAITALMKE